MDIPQRAPEEIHRRLAGGEPLALLDVREDDERSLCRLPAPNAGGDLHIPLREVPTRLDEIAAAATVGRLVVYCHHGQRSMVAASWLARRGVVGVENLEGGIDAWSLRVDPSVARY